MFSSKTKTIIIVFVVLLCTGLVAVGCKPKPKKAWVNTNSMPGHTFASYKNSNKVNSSAVVYLGTENQSKEVNFGPADVNFEFQALR